MLMKLLSLVLCFALFGGCYAAVGKHAGVNRVKSGQGKSGRSDGDSQDSSIPSGPGLPGGPPDINPAQGTIDIDAPEGNIVEYSGDQLFDEGSGPDQESSGYGDQPCFELRERLKSTDAVGPFVPRCTEDGQFRSMQCDKQQYCWCVDLMGKQIKLKAPDNTYTENFCDRETGRVADNPHIIDAGVTPSHQPSTTDDIGIGPGDKDSNVINPLPGGPGVDVQTISPDSNQVGYRADEIGDKEVEKANTSILMGHPGILAGIIGGAVVGLLCAVLLVMFIVYRMRKKDEGSYALDEPRKSPTLHGYRPANQKEYYA